MANTLTLAPGQTAGLTGANILADGYTPFRGGDYSWSTSNISVAAVTVNTKWANDHRNVLITAIAVGTATITCTSGSSTSQIMVVVAIPTPATIHISLGDPVTPTPDGWLDDDHY